MGQFPWMGAILGGNQRVSNLLAKAWSWDSVVAGSGPSPSAGSLGKSWHLALHLCSTQRAGAPWQLQRAGQTGTGG